MHSMSPFNRSAIRFSIMIKKRPGNTNPPNLKFPFQPPAFAVGSEIMPMNKTDFVESSPIIKTNG